MKTLGQKNISGGGFPGCPRSCGLLPAHAPLSGGRFCLRASCHLLDQLLGDPTWTGDSVASAGGSVEAEVQCGDVEELCAHPRQGSQASGDFGPGPKGTCSPSSGPGAFSAPASPDPAQGHLSLWRSRQLAQCWVKCRARQSGEEEQAGVRQWAAGSWAGPGCCSELGGTFQIRPTALFVWVTGPVQGCFLGFSSCERWQGLSCTQGPAPPPTGCLGGGLGAAGWGWALTGPLSLCRAELL